MADFNKVILTGRLTRDPEVRQAGNSRVMSFGVACNDRKKSGDEWVDNPMFVDVIHWLGKEGSKSWLVDNLAKGKRVIIEGKLELDTWEDKQSGAKRSKHKVVAFSIDFLDRPGKADDQPKAMQLLERILAEGDAAQPSQASGRQRDAPVELYEDQVVASSSIPADIPF